VVTGEDTEGRSVFVSNDSISDWVRRPTGLSVTEVWRADSLPVRLDGNSTPPDGVIVAPTASGLSVRVAVFPPDREIEPEQIAAYEASMRDLYGDQGDQQTDDIAGMHRTDTIDVITVIEGEIHLLLDEGETLLRPGDCLIQRGARHAWRNRSDHPCILVSTVLPAARQ
jgi:mannose-6-phosphate isomerase-like protein (cupin superfamily)